jgi:hypothetical protein
VHICTATREQGRRIAVHLFQGKVRVTGVGTYVRNGFGEWERRRFVMESFALLDMEPLGAVIAQLRSLGGPVSDPTPFLEEIRRAEERQMVGIDANILSLFLFPSASAPHDFKTGNPIAKRTNGRSH